MTQKAIAVLELEKESAGQVYLFDTGELDLLKQGVIVRMRQGANNDLSVKVRAPEGNKQVDTTKLRGQFPCEIDRTGEGENSSYSVRRKYRPLHVPETGHDILGLLSLEQKRLLQEAQVSIDWTRVTRIANIKSTSWETSAQPPFRKLTMELWEWPTGDVLEISTKVEPEAGPSNYAELQRLVNDKGLSLSAIQGTKTKRVLETITNHSSDPK